MDVFPIIPGDVRMGWAFALSALLLAVFVVVSWLLFTSLRAATTAQFFASPAGLTLRGDVYGRVIPIQKLRLDGAMAVDLRVEDGLEPKRKLNGTDVPGYSSGWFRLDSGEKALLYLTDRTRVAYIPTIDGYSVMLSVEEPSRLIDSLRRHAQAAAGR
ncbi:MAG: hypothetical protein KIS64_01825 [Fimbriimonadaceae bacterium]|nr:hypothetical protein [Fimbriimonadaceae bacterium]